MSMTQEALVASLRGFFGGNPGVFTPTYGTPPGTAGTPIQFPAGTPGAPGFTPTGGTAGQRDAFASLRGTLDFYGLGGLTEWLWDQIINDVPEAEIFINLRQQPTFKQRFPALEARRKLGLPDISLDDYIRTESAYRNALRNFGFDERYYDSPADFVALFSADESADEFNARLEVWDDVMNVRGPRLRQAFLDYAGLGLEDTDVYGLLSGQRPELVEEYANATGTPIDLPLATLKTFTATPIATLRQSLRRAVSEEEALFKAGGEPATSIAGAVRPRAETF